MSLVSTKSTGHNKDVTARIRELVVGLGIVGFKYDAALSVTIPSFTAGGANTSNVKLVDVTVSGVAVGDSVLSADPTQALPTNAVFLGASVTATDTVTFVFTNLPNAAVTGAGKTFSLVVADRT